MCGVALREMPTDRRSCRTGRVDFLAFVSSYKSSEKILCIITLHSFFFSCCAIIILSASSFVNAKMRLVISQFEGILRIIWSAIPISFTFPVRSKMYMASAHGTIVQSILHYKNWSHSPLYAFRFFRYIKTPHLSDQIRSDKWGAVHQGRTLFLFCL